MLSSNLGGEYKHELYNIADNSAVKGLVNSILQDMDPLLTSRQLTALYNLLEDSIKNYSISGDKTLYGDIDYKELNNQLLEKFLEDKKLMGLSEKSLDQYQLNLIYVFNYLDKGVDTITADDIRDFLRFKLEECNNSMCTLDNYRRFLSSFYNHCVNNGYLYNNPMRKVDSIKRVRKIKQAFSNEEIIYLRENLNNLRDKAIFELLLSSGMRIGELVKLNKSDLNLTDCSVIVHGKGNKERECFFNDLAKVSIKRYLDSRVDDNPALFVNLDKRCNRLNIGGVGDMLRNLGKRSGVSKVHAHRFRRHFATTLLRKGVQIEQIQKLLGHVNIETTKLYVVLNEDETQYNHKRYVN